MFSPTARCSDTCSWREERDGSTVGRSAGRWLPPRSMLALRGCMGDFQSVLCAHHHRRSGCKWRALTPFLSRLRHEVVLSRRRVTPGLIMAPRVRLLHRSGQICRACAALISRFTPTTNAPVEGSKRSEWHSFCVFSTTCVRSWAVRGA